MDILWDEVARQGSVPAVIPYCADCYVIVCIRMRMEGSLMKRYVSLAIAFVLVLSISAGSISANSPVNTGNTKNSIFITDLMASKHHDIGDILVWHDADTLYVKYEVHLGWLHMVESHLHVAGSLSEFPLNNGGNPKLGQFAYYEDHGRWVMEYTFEIPRDPSWVTGTDVCIAAHTLVAGLCGLMATGWGDGIEFPGWNWSMYFVYTF